MLYRLVRVCVRARVCVCDIALVRCRYLNEKKRTVYTVCNMKFRLIFFHAFQNELNVAISTTIVNTGYLVSFH